MRINTETTDEGVSPVVGVILMVAITVILSAIIATFVLDLGGTVSQNPSAGVSFDQEVMSGSLSSDGDSVTDYSVTMQLVSVENADSVSYSTTDNAGDTDGFSGTIGSAAGDQATAGTSGTDGLEAGDKVTVTATLEGKTSVIQTYTVDSE